MPMFDMLTLKGVHLAPYIQIATILRKIPRKGVLMKASLVHDLFEEVPYYNRNDFLDTDFEAHAVYKLVMEVTKRENESKPDFLTRILKEGSVEAKTLKTADRISNMVALGFVTEKNFIERTTNQTEQYILPIAAEVDQSMYNELKKLIESRRRYAELIGKEVVHTILFPPTST